MTTRIYIKRPSGSTGPSSPPVDKLTQDIENLRALGPDVLVQMVKPVYKGIDCLHRESTRDNLVSATGQTIGSVLNLGTIGGYLTSTGTQRPLYRGPNGARFDGVDDTLFSSWSETTPQPITHVMYFRRLLWTSGNRRMFGNLSDADLRHDIGLGSSFGAFSNGHLLNNAGTSVRSEWGLGTADARSSRVVCVYNGATSEVTWTGDFPYSTGTINVGTNGMEGLVLGSLRGSANTFVDMTCAAYVRFPKVLTSSEIAKLPDNIGE
jgi:hypothetical protein